MSKRPRPIVVDSFTELNKLNSMSDLAIADSHLQNYQLVARVLLKAADITLEAGGYTWPPIVKSTIASAIVEVSKAIEELRKIQEALR